MAMGSVEASSNAEQPAPHTYALLHQVQQLGHYPNRYQTPTSEQQRKENALARKIGEQWTKLPEQTRQELIAFKVQGKRDVQVLKEVHELGHYPRRWNRPSTDEEKREDH